MEMSKNLNLNLYKGRGVTIKQRGLELPDYDPCSSLEEAKYYIADPGLKDAVNVALALGQPLLITGEPGTGKTSLAASIAWELGLDLLTFNTKTTSTADDLFYHYDALRRFQDSNSTKEGNNKGIENYITCMALGSAILLTNPTERAKQILPEGLKDKGPSRSIVLIDEIDKAPRDLPNDLLNEVEKMEFSVKGTTWEPFRANSKYRPVIVLSSNSEKNLPDAFLRRCVFYHIDFPAPDELRKIVINRFRKDSSTEPQFTKEFLKGAEDHFYKIRQMDIKKKPATAEYLAWISVLKSLDLDMAGLNIHNLNDNDRQSLELSYPVLAKTREDMELLKKNLKR